MEINYGIVFLIEIDEKHLMLDVIENDLRGKLYAFRGFHPCTSSDEILAGSTRAY